MKTFIFCTLILFSVNFIFSQDSSKRVITVEEAAGGRNNSYEISDPQFKNTGSLFIINWGMIYRVDRLPAYSIGAAIHFPLSNRLAIESGLSLLNAKISTDEEFEGSTDVTSGSVTYTDVDITFKYFLKPNFWMGFGFAYETMIDGYYVDEVGGIPIHTELSRDEEQSLLAIKLAFGLLSPIGRETYAAPSFFFRYNIPVDPKMEKKNIYVGVNFGLAIKLGNEK